MLAVSRSMVGLAGAGGAFGKIRVEQQMLTRVLLALVCLFLQVTHSYADQPPSYATCVACHGAAGEGNPALNAPAIAGQSAEYLERQLRHFKSGVRGGDSSDALGMQMRGMAASLSDEGIRAVSTWLSEQPRPQVTPSHAGDLKNGNDYYHSKCDACHGAWGEGNERLHAPAIAWLDAEYIKRQFENYGSGLRGSHPEDVYGKQMQLMSDVLPEEGFIDDIIAYMQARAAADGAPL